MYEVSVQDHFDAAHFLRGYQGRCENLHGHRYQVVVTLRAEQLNDLGLAFDFTELKRRLKQILGRLDHVCLNDVPPFDQINPSAENIACNIYQALAQEKLDKGVSLAQVQVWDSPDAWATYRP